MRRALLVIDVQRAFDDGSWGERNNPGAEQNVALLLDAWRSAYAPVIHVRHVSSGSVGRFRPGTPAFQFKAEAAPAPGETVIEKRAHSAFIGTGLAELLRARGISESQSRA